MERRNFLGWVGAIPGMAVWGSAGCGGSATSDDSPAGPEDRGGTDAAGGGGPDAFDGDAALPEAEGGPIVSDAASTDALACEATRNDALGPFYEPGAPERTMIAGPEEPGERVLIRGRVLGADCATPVPNAIVDVWHADANGEYHTSQESWRLRGQMKTDALGRYEFQTILPGYYSGRPKHYHYMVTAPGFVPLVTQLYFVGDPFLGSADSCQLPTCDSNDPRRIIDLVPGPTAESPVEGRFEVSLARA